MRRLWLCVIALGSVGALLSCGSGSLDGGGTCQGVGGRGGGAGGGVGGSSTGATGGLGGAVKVGSWRQLSCITTLLTECPLEGACTKQELDGGSNTVTTFASGVTVSYQASSACAVSTTDGVWAYEVRGGDGSLCFSKQVVIKSTMGCEHGAITFMNASGQVVANGNVSSGAFTLACADGAETCGGTGGFGGADCDPPLDVSCPAGCP